MDTAFDAAIEIVFKMEGGYVNDARDPGGETKYGISKAAFPNVDIANLTRDGAKEIYRQHYWFKYKCDRMPWPVSAYMLDCLVNHSPGNPARWLQEAVGAVPDGAIGEKTIAAVRASNDVFRVVAEIVKKRIQYVKTLPTYPAFGKGWHNRHVDALVEAMRWYFKFAE